MGGLLNEIWLRLLALRLITYKNTKGEKSEYTLAAALDSENA